MNNTDRTDVVNEICTLLSTNFDGYDSKALDEVRNKLEALSDEDLMEEYSTLNSELNWLKCSAFDYEGVAVVYQDQLIKFK